MNLGGSELIIVLIVLVVVFGSAWLPKAARNLGRAKVEMDKTQKQIADTKQQVVEATGLREIESTMRKANRALNTSPQNLIKGAAASAMKPTAKPDATSEADDNIPDAEIVTPKKPSGDDNINLDFS